MQSPKSNGSGRHRRTLVAGAFAVALAGSVLVATAADAAPTTDDPRATSFSGSVNKCPAGTTPLLHVANGNSGSNALVTGTSSNGGRYLTLTFASSLTGAGVIAFVKGGPGYNRYDIVVGTTDTADLRAPFTANGSLPQISHFIVCQSSAPPPTPQFETPPGIWLGYADDFHGVGGATVSFVPSPWKGDPSVVYVGCSGASECGGTGTGKFDGGAIRIDNIDDDAALTLKSARVDIGECAFTPWTTLLPQTAAAGKRFVLTQSGMLGAPMPFPCAAAIDPMFHAETNFDTSERPGDTRNPTHYDCNPAVRHTPVITLTFEDGAPDVTADDVTVTINDTGRVLNTGGTDSFACTGLDEATPWTGPIPY